MLPPIFYETQRPGLGSEFAVDVGLALARVLLADFPVVILDEPAEHLDEETADELTRDLLGAVAGRTVLLITHRPVDPATVDQVLRLADGRVTPAHLVALQGPGSRS